LKTELPELEPEQESSGWMNKPPVRAEKPVRKKVRVDEKKVF
jgi:hypothetical protein